MCNLAIPVSIAILFFMGIDINRIRQEITIKTARSGGKGGQHVNKVETKVQLTFNIRESAALSEEEKTLILSRLADKITNNGEIMVSDESTRSQGKNKEIAYSKLEQLLAKAFVRKKKRKKTRPTRASKLARLKSKKIRSEKKRLRKKPNGH